MQLHHDLDKLRATRAEIAVIGNGAPMFIAGFRETTGYAGRLYTDPTLAVYRAAQLRRGLRTLLAVGAVTRTVSSLRRGFRQGKTQGDALQQGGTLVVSRDGTIVWRHISQGPGDHATTAAIVAALGTVAAA